MRNFPTLDEVEDQYFKDHPDEIESYLIELYEDYAKDENSAALLESLEIIARVKGEIK